MREHTSPTTPILTMACARRAADAAPDDATANWLLRLLAHGEAAGGVVGSQNQGKGGDDDLVVAVPLRLPKGGER